MIFRIKNSKKYVNKYKIKTLLININNSYWTVCLILRYSQRNTIHSKEEWLVKNLNVYIFTPK